MIHYNTNVELEAHHTPHTHTRMRKQSHPCVISNHLCRKHFITSHVSLLDLISRAIHNQYIIK